MKQTIQKIAIIITIVCLLLVIGYALFIAVKPLNSDSLCIRLKKYDWHYELSEEGVLIEERKYSRFGFSMYTYHEFVAGKAGDVTISWTASEYGDVVEEKCFQVTYSVDDEGNIIKTASENEPQTPTGFTYVISEMLLIIFEGTINILDWVCKIFMRIF